MVNFALHSACHCLPRSPLPHIYPDKCQPTLFRADGAYTTDTMTGHWRVSKRHQTVRENWLSPVHAPYISSIMGADESAKLTLHTKLAKLGHWNMR